MKPNNTIREIGDALQKAGTVWIIPHELMDGDAFGSAIALCKSLRKENKKAWILLEDKIPDYLEFMDKGYCTYDQDLLPAPDVSLCIDCGDRTRFKKRVAAFDKGKTTICLDHHTTSRRVFDLNYVDGKAAATGEIVFDLLSVMNWPLDKEIAEAIFVAITTDTGNFQYSNTSQRSHEIVIALYDKGMNFSKISAEIYQNESMNKFKMESKVIDSAELFADGLGVVATVTQKMLKECNSSMEEAEGIVSKLRSIRGVEISVLIKEYPDGCMKVGLRAKHSGDVAVIASKFGGGGHVKAAGCTICDTIENVKQMIVQEVTEQLRT
jgi:phosphoesterase RecJ-like protein